MFATPLISFGVKQAPRVVFFGMGLAMSFATFVIVGAITHGSAFAAGIKVGKKVKNKK